MKNNNDYKYIYHWSPFRPKERAWACFHRDDEKHYWNGIGPDKSGLIVKQELRIFFGKNPDDAWHSKTFKYN